MSKQTPMTVEGFMAFMELLQVDTEEGIMERAKEFGMRTHTTCLLRFDRRGKIRELWVQVDDGRVSVPAVHSGYEVPHDKPTNP